MIRIARSNWPKLSEQERNLYEALGKTRLEWRPICLACSVLPSVSKMIRTKTGYYCLECKTEANFDMTLKTLGLAVPKKTETLKTLEEKELLR